MTEYSLHIEDTYYCPLNRKHQFHDLGDWISHMCECKIGNYSVKRFICRFDHFHWFDTPQKRVLHETFVCCKQHKVMAHSEVILNFNNEVILPLVVKSENELRTYFKFGNTQSRPNYYNFLHQYKQDRVERNYDQTKRVKMGDISNQTSWQPK